MQPEQQPVQPITPAAPPTSPQPFVGNMPMQQYTQVPQPHYTDIWGIMSIIFAFLFSPVGLILGIIGIAQAKKHQASKILSIIGTALSSISMLLVIPILAGLVIVTFNGIQQKGRDTERQTDIKALHGQLEAYYAQNGRYPTFANVNDVAFRATNMQGLEIDALQDPNWNVASSCVSEDLPVISDKVVANCYSYVTSPAGCNNTTVDCTSYVLTALLEGQINGQGTYVKSALNF